MRAISIIYRRELGAYLRAPSYWVIAFVALIVQGVLFQAHAMSGEQLSAMVLERFFWLSSGIAIGAGILLSFRLLAEERQTHSMILLTTSPVRDSHIVLGKFFAAQTFLAILLALSFYMPMLIKVNGKITMAQVLVGYVGLFLLGSTVLAIGIFASSLTKNMVVAALGALGITLLFCLLFPLAKRLDAPVSDVFKELDIWWVHFQQGFMRGVLNLKDIIFYLAFIYFFLLLAVKTMEAKRWQ
ncbi:MAG: ABC transporter permease [Kofleriaceae bacterium]